MRLPRRRRRPHAPPPVTLPCRVPRRPGRLAETTVVVAHGRLPPPTPRRALPPARPQTHLPLDGRPLPPARPSTPGLDPPKTRARADPVGVLEFPARTK